MIDFAIKQGDLLPTLEATFTDTNGPIDLTNASVVFYYKLKNSSLATPATGVMSVSTPTSGIATYIWASGETVTPGTYIGEFVVTFPNTKQLSFPTDSFLVFEVVKDIN